MRLRIKGAKLGDVEAMPHAAAATVQHNMTPQPPVSTNTMLSGWSGKVAMFASSQDMQVKKPKAAACGSVLRNEPERIPGITANYGMPAI